MKPSVLDTLVFLKREQIDESRWEKCHQQYGYNKLLYNQIWYLDALMGSDWQAAIWCDYKAALPLPVQIKKGFSILANPISLQQVHFCGNQQDVDFEALWQKLIKRFGKISWAIDQNFWPNLKPTIRINQVLDTSSSTLNLVKKNRKNELAKVEDKGLELILHNSYREGLRYLQSNFHRIGVQFSKSDFKKLENLMQVCQKKQKARFVFIQHKADILGFYFWTWKGTILIYHIFSYHKNTGALHLTPTLSGLK